MFNPSSRNNNGRFVKGWKLDGPDHRDHTKGGRKQLFVEENEGQHFCQCGCGEPIKILPAHLYYGIPRFSKASHIFKTGEHRTAAAARAKTRKKDKHWNWKGGITPLAESIRKSKEYKDWRNAVLARDKWTCQRCGLVRYGRTPKFEAHHIVSFSTLLAAYKRDIPKLMRKLLFLGNGITLCEHCHQKIPVPRTKRKST